MPDSAYVRGLKSFTIPPNAPTIERAVSRLRNAIMLGELRPGQKLVEAELGRTLDISRASLREALRALESERLIELVPNRGPSVARLGYQEIESIHEVWALLTGAAVYDFAKVAKPTDLAELDAALEALRQSIQSNQPLKQLAATNTFFMAILSKCGNSVLTEVIISLVSRVNFLRAQALLYRGWGVLYSEEIAGIVAAIRARNPDAAREAACKHIASACAAAKQVAASPEPVAAPLPKAKNKAKAPASAPRRRASAKKSAA